MTQLMLFGNILKGDKINIDGEFEAEVLSCQSYQDEVHLVEIRYRDGEETYLLLGDLEKTYSDDLSFFDESIGVGSLLGGDTVEDAEYEVFAIYDGKVFMVKLGDA